MAKILELNETDELQVISCRLIPKDNAANFNDGQRRDVETIKKEILKLLPEDYVYSNTNQLIYIHKEGQDRYKLEFRKKVEEVQQDVQRSL